MKRMLCEMFTNRLGNVLAISHLSLIAINASGTWIDHLDQIFVRGKRAG
jgi:hypothetical protein